MFSSVFVCMCGSPLCLIVCWVLYFFLVSAQTTTKQNPTQEKKLYWRVEDEVLWPSSLSDCKFSGYNVGIFHSRNAPCVMSIFINIRYTAGTLVGKVQTAHFSTSLSACRLWFQYLKTLCAGSLYSLFYPLKSIEIMHTHKYTHTQLHKLDRVTQPLSVTLFFIVFYFIYTIHISHLFVTCKCQLHLPVQNSQKRFCHDRLLVLSCVTPLSLFCVTQCHCHCFVSHRSWD